MERSLQYAVDENLRAVKLVMRESKDNAGEPGMQARSAATATTARLHHMKKARGILTARIPE